MADFIELHRTLLESTRDAHLAGWVRDRQNWIGGNNHNPRGAAFVPPPEGMVRPLLDDLAAFLNRSDLPATLQAAIAHAQFETIRPFAEHQTDLASRERVSEKLAPARDELTVQSVRPGGTQRAGRPSDEREHARRRACPFDELERRHDDHRAGRR
jgi:hypothetical protein